MKKHLRPAPAQGRFLIHFMLIAALAAASLLTGCAHTPGAGEDPPALVDLERMPQDAEAYLDPARADTPLVPAAAQTRLAQAYTRAFFSPWKQTEPAQGPDKVFKLLVSDMAKTFYGENTRRIPAEAVTMLRLQADMEHYPNAGAAAITVVSTSMRVVPTISPVFRDFREAGEGFPFDYNQNSGVWAQTPVYVSHYSTDGAWALCETSTAYGWIPTRDIALVDDEFIKTFSSCGLATFTRDRTPVTDVTGLFRFKGRIGMVLPLIGNGGGEYDVLLAMRDDLGRARLSTASVPASVAGPFPLPATPAQFARLGNELLGQPYGWGGLFESRDCSATVQDMYAAFGVFMPRNSTQQANHFPMTSLEGLDDEAKLTLIDQNARPWGSLLWKRGHIMIYVGKKDGRHAILHTAWGLKTKDFRGNYGRHVIGATVITSLRPGDGLHSLARPEGELIYNLRGLVQIF